MEKMQQINERVKELMAEPGRGWQRQKLADKTGMSYQGIKKLLDGGGVSVDSLFALAKAFNVSPYWLYTGEGERSTWFQAVGGTVAKAPEVQGDAALSQKAVTLGLLYDTAPVDEDLKVQLFRRASAVLLGFAPPASSPESAAPAPAETLKKSDV